MSGLLNKLTGHNKTTTHDSTIPNNNTITTSQTTTIPSTGTGLTGSTTHLNSGSGYNSSLGQSNIGGSVYSSGLTGSSIDNGMTNSSGITTSALPRSGISSTSGLTGSYGGNDGLSSNPGLANNTGYSSNLINGSGINNGMSNVGNSHLNSNSGLHSGLHPQQSGLTGSSAGSYGSAGDRYDNGQSRLGQDSMTRSEEQLRVQKTTVPAGKAELNKTVETQHVTQAVPVQRETAVLQREPINATNMTHAPPIAEAHYETTLKKDIVSATKETVPIERIRLAKQTEVGVENIDADLKKEHIDLVTDKYDSGRSGMGSDWNKTDNLRNTNQSTGWNAGKTDNIGTSAVNTNSSINTAAPRQTY